MSNVAKIIGRASVNESQNLFTCADRVSPGDQPRDITSIKSMYIPFDVKNKATHLRKNPFGVVIYRRDIEAGKIYHAFDGKRLVIELGCNTVIYIHINVGQPSKHHRLFIQSESAFSGDTTIRRDAAIIVKNTRHVETIVKYEMYFIMGVLSTTSIGAWLMVTGADVTFLYTNKIVMANAAKKLSGDLLRELDEVGTYAPILKQKIWELIVAEGKGNTVRAAKVLPQTIVTDQKVQAQVAGVIFGKWAMPQGNPFTLWTLIGAILTQAAVKSVTKYGDAYVKAVDHRYKPILEEMKSANPLQPSTLQKPATSLLKILREAGVSVTLEEASGILLEILRNKERAYKNLTAITKSIDEFRRVVNK